MAKVDSLAAFRAEARGSGVPEAEIERWIAEFALPCALLYLPEQAPEGAPVVGTAGGRPLLPVQAWPPGLPLLVSVDLAAIPRDAIGLPLPEDGRLLLFGDLRENKPTFMSYSPHQLIYVPVGTEVSVRPPPPALRPRAAVPRPGGEIRHLPARRVLRAVTAADHLVSRGRLGDQDVVRGSTARSASGRAAVISRPD
ncbi:YwqG family protein [Actinoplanes awajinensis]|uniref:Uncharacterized protein n=1 Tax=Actinoplanes awajinensis subsp. mycoplanecinus TaxID=135947 RepID=A0A101JTX7_9ACTN|nr:hypothetical protein [Actinoplanes awajinensis]KUL33043.1 hypothetical protein ADL15_18705 [Actinoplanes awajinensis subsp. mycoplanecinus]